MGRLGEIVLFAFTRNGSVAVSVASRRGSKEKGCCSVAGPRAAMVAHSKPPLDPKVDTFYKNKRLVDQFRVVGRVAELGVKSSLKGLQGLRPHHLPATISMGVDHRGERDVQVHPEDREMAVRITRHVRARMGQANLSLQGAIVKEPDSTGEHDMVVDRVADGEGDPGLVSTEMKCRRLWSEAGKAKVRKALRREEVSECKWWQQALQKPRANWYGRMIILVFVDQSRAITSRAELKPANGSDWQAIWGWRSRRLDDEPAPRRAAASSPPTRAMAAAPKPKARAVPLRGRDLPFPTLAFRTEQGRRVAPVNELLTQTKRAAGHPGRSAKAVKWARTDLGTDTPQGLHTDELFEAPRKSGKRGGRPEWVGTARVLRLLHAELP